MAAYTIDGRKVVGLTTRLEAGYNSLELVLPTSMYVIRVSGTGYSYSTKLQSKASTATQAGIKFLSNTKAEASAPQKSKATPIATTTMTYSTGDQLLYKATSGIYSTIVTDVPTASKTTNFYFVACTDGDGNNYTTVRIGTQTWMVENLKTTKYNDGTALPLVTDDTEWSVLSTPAYCWYNNDATTYKDKCGALYNWYAASENRNIAPIGWHVATDVEWTNLINYVSADLGASLSVSKALAATTDWPTFSTNGTIGCNLAINNSTGFFAIPGGFRANSGPFLNLGFAGVWWCSSGSSTTNGWDIFCSYQSRDMGKGVSYTYTYGYSVRCIMD